MKKSMTKYRILLIILSIIILLSGIFFYKYFFKSWSPYYQEKLCKEPRLLLLKTADLFSELPNEKKNALDLGAGTGNDTAFLLKNGWHVWANDIEKEAIKIIASREDILPYKKNLVLIHKSFIDLPWHTLPQFDLIYAGYSLPFATPTDFMEIWKQIKQALLPEGLFAGHFFGSDHGGFNWWIKRKMNFFTKEQLLELFNGFTIEFFEELYQKNKQGILDHSFNVIARKSN